MVLQQARPKQRVECSQHDSQHALPCVAGLLITYTVMFGDVLVGKAPDYNGALTNLAGRHSGEDWFLDRRFVVSASPCPSHQSAVTLMMLVWQSCA